MVVLFHSFWDEDNKIPANQATYQVKVTNANMSLQLTVGFIVFS